MVTYIWVWVLVGVINMRQFGMVFGLVLWLLLGADLLIKVMLVGLMLDL